MKAKKGRAKKIVLIILCSLLALILGFIGLCAILNTIGHKASMEMVQSFSSVEYENQLIPEKDADGVWTFTTDEDIRIMQLTDIHIGGGWLCADKDTMALNAVAAMIKEEKPDLVIMTGDIVYPVPFQAFSMNNLKPAELVANLMESLGVYWLPVYGNHDTESYSLYNREDITKFYGSGDYKYCLMSTDNITDDVDGYSNTVINVKNSDGLITQSLYSFDTHSYVDGDYFGLFWKYDNIHENQLEWYRSNVEKYNRHNLNVIEKKFADNKDEMVEKYGIVKSLAFFHVPATEYLDAWNGYVEAGYQNTEDITYHYGTVGEGGSLIYHGLYEDELFETMQELGSTKGMFCGHDHLNNFSIDYKGIRLTYGYSIDYLAYSGIYKLGSQRGCTMITVTPEGDFDCVAENYYQEKYQTLNDYQKEPVEMQTLNPEHK